MELMMTNCLEMVFTTIYILGLQQSYFDCNFLVYTSQAITDQLDTT